MSNISLKLVIIFILLFGFLNSACIIRKMTTHLEVFGSWEEEGNKLDLEAKLTYVNMETGQRLPLPGRVLNFNVTVFRNDGTNESIIREVMTNSLGWASRTFYLDDVKEYQVLVSFDGDSGFKNSVGTLGGSGAFEEKSYETNLPEGINVVTCLPILLLFGFLGAAMYASGGNPFGFVDMTTTRGFRMNRNLRKMIMVQSAGAIVSQLSMAVAGGLKSIRTATTRLKGDGEEGATKKGGESADAEQKPEAPPPKLPEGGRSGHGENNSGGENIGLGEKPELTPPEGSASRILRGLIGAFSFIGAILGFRFFDAFYGLTKDSEGNSRNPLLLASDQEVEQKIKNLQEDWLEDRMTPEELKAKREADLNNLILETQAELGLIEAQIGRLEEWNEKLKNGISIEKGNIMRNRRQIRNNKRVLNRLKTRKANLEKINFGQMRENLASVFGNERVSGNSELTIKELMQNAKENGDRELINAIKEIKSFNKDVRSKRDDIRGNRLFQIDSESIIRLHMKENEIYDKKPSEIDISSISNVKELVIDNRDDLIQQMIDRIDNEFDMFGSSSTVLLLQQNGVVNERESELILDGREKEVKEFREAMFRTNPNNDYNWRSEEYSPVQDFQEQYERNLERQEKLGEEAEQLRIRAEQLLEQGNREDAHRLDIKRDEIISEIRNIESSSENRIARGYDIEQRAKKKDMEVPEYLENNITDQFEKIMAKQDYLYYSQRSEGLGGGENVGQVIDHSMRNTTRIKNLDDEIKSILQASEYKIERLRGREDLTPEQRDRIIDDIKKDTVELIKPKDEELTGRYEIIKERESSAQKVCEEIQNRIESSDLSSEQREELRTQIEDRIRKQGEEWRALVRQMDETIREETSGTRKVARNRTQNRRDATTISNFFTDDEEEKNRRIYDNYTEILNSGEISERRRRGIERERDRAHEELRRISIEKTRKEYLEEKEEKPKKEEKKEVKEETPKVEEKKEKQEDVKEEKPKVEEKKEKEVKEEKPKEVKEEKKEEVKEEKPKEAKEEKPKVERTDEEAERRRKEQEEYFKGKGKQNQDDN